MLFYKIQVLYERIIGLSLAGAAINDVFSYDEVYAYVKTLNGNIHQKMVAKELKIGLNFGKKLKEKSYFNTCIVYLTSIKKNKHNFNFNF